MPRRPFTFVTFSLSWAKRSVNPHPWLLTTRGHRISPTIQSTMRALNTLSVATTFPRRSTVRTRDARSLPYTQTRTLIHPRFIPYFTHTCTTHARSLHPVLVPISYRRHPSTALHSTTPMHARIHDARSHPRVCTRALIRPCRVPCFTHTCTTHVRALRPLAVPIPHLRRPCSVCSAVCLSLSPSLLRSLHARAAAITLVISTTPSFIVPLIPCRCCVRVPLSCLRTFLNRVQLCAVMCASHTAPLYACFPRVLHAARASLCMRCVCLTCRLCSSSTLHPATHARAVMFTACMRTVVAAVRHAHACTATAAAP